MKPIVPPPGGCGLILRTRRAAGPIRTPRPPHPQSRLQLELDDGGVLLAQALDAQADRSPAFRNCGGFMPKPTPGGVPVVMTSPGSSVMNWLTVAHQLGDAEDHRARVAVLHALAVDVQPHVEVLRFGDLVGRHEPRADRAEGVAALALVPLRRRARAGIRARRRR